MIFITPSTLFSLLANHLKPDAVIVEAGAFTGKDTQKLAQISAEYSVHAFEPEPTIFKELERNTREIVNIKRYNLALSNTQGTALFHKAYNPKKPDMPCQAGSLLAPKDRLLHSPIIYTETIPVETITLDSWSKAYNVEHVDFLWLDLQGHELSALQGATSLLKTVSLLYIELNFINAYENQPEHSTVITWICQQGFTPLAQDFGPNPTWFFGNMLFKRVE